MKDLIDDMASGTTLTRETFVKPSDGPSLFERLAVDPNVTVEKLERLIAMQEHILEVNAKSAFNAAFSLMQPEIPVIDEQGRIEVKGTLRSTYATLEDIHDVIKPITARHGFAIRHRTEWPADKPGVIRIVGILSHKDGHAEESTFEAPMDRSDYRTDIQSMGSTVSYGRRYTTLDLLNIATRKADNDGQKPAAKPEAPAGYTEWLTDMTAVAENGTKELQAAWNKSQSAFRAYLTQIDPIAWRNLKAKAAKVGA